MAWQWYEGAWNDFADRSFNPAVGCSNLLCADRKVCWARREFDRRKDKLWPGQSFEQPFDIWEQPCKGASRGWQGFRAKPGERIALGWMGDLFDPGRSKRAILNHLDEAIERSRGSGLIWLLQTRHVAPAVSWFIEMHLRSFELGTTLSSLADLKNVRLLGQLPENVVRFIAFEPADNLTDALYCGWDGWNAIQAAKPNWAYIGFRTPRKRILTKVEYDDALADPDLDQTIMNELLDKFSLFTGIPEGKLIFKRSCGPEWYARNEGVTLPETEAKP